MGSCLIPHRGHCVVVILHHAEATGLLPCATQKGKDCYLVPYKVDWSAFLYIERIRLLYCVIQSGLVLCCIIHSEQGIILYNTEGTDQLLPCTIQRGLTSCYLVPYRGDCRYSVPYRGDCRYSVPYRGDWTVVIVYHTEGTDQLLPCTIQRGLSL